MMLGKVKAICISPVAGVQMQIVDEVEAVAGAGLKGDRYATGEGSFNKKTGIVNRQVTLINHIFFAGSDFEYHESRRNIVTEGVELMWLIGREFQIGGARFCGVKYCDPCQRPSKLAGKEQSFMGAFFDRGGIVAQVLEGGIIRVNDSVIPPDKGY
jgi:MOSC domain-containing protein YiiM